MVKLMQVLGGVYMFCPNCGTENDGSAVFCENCGTKIIEEQRLTVTDNVFVDQRVNSGLGKLINFVTTHRTLLAGLISCLVVVIIFFVIGNALSSPDRVVSKYAKALSDGNYEKLYGALKIEDSAFKTKEIYVQSFGRYHDEYYSENSQIKSYSVEALSETDESLGITDLDFYDENGDDFPSSRLSYKIRFIFTDEHEEIKVVTLEKQKQKFLLFFPVYKTVDFDENATFTLTVPDCCNVTLDDIGLSESNCSVTYNDNSTVSYSVDVFKGYHAYEVKGDYYETKAEEICITSPTYNVVAELYFNDSVHQELNDKALSFIEEVYEHALAGDDFSDLDSEFVSDSYDMKTSYEYLVSNMKNYSGEKVESIILHDITASSGAFEGYYIGDPCKVELSFFYDYEALLRESYFSSEMKKYSSEYPIEGYASVYFVLEDDKWVISYFSIPEMEYLI